MSRRSYPLSYAAWSLAGLLSPLTASAGWTATLRASSSAPDLLGEAALWGGILAAAGAAALIAIPAVRRVVMPPPAETYLSDLLQFERVLDDETLARRAGAAGRAKVAARFSWPAVATQHLEIYHALLAGAERSA